MRNVLRKPCLTCGGLTRHGSYCRRHEPKRTSPGRGSGPTAARFRRETLAKTGGLCALCGSDDRVEAHHVIGLNEGGTNDAQTNGLPLCFDCHRETEKARLRAGAQHPSALKPADNLPRPVERHAERRGQLVD